ncbi:MAG: nucleotidyltransferase domain-containing protein [Cyanobacteriota bacterium]
MFKDKKKKFQIDIKHIAHGTQVVTLSDKIFADVKYKSGRTGVVIESSISNNSYIVRFSDDIEIEYTREELVIRKIEIENFIQNFAPNSKELEKYIIYECMVGSRAFGLSDESSDDDIRGIYLSPVSLVMSLWGAPEQIEDRENDRIYWEIEKYLRLALKANPNVLETLWTPMIIKQTELAKELINIREVFLSKHIFKTFGGYALSQFTKMKNEYERTGKYRVKHALHLIRLLISGALALKEGYIMVDVSEYKNDLMSIKTGKLNFDEIQEWRKELQNKFNCAYENTILPDLPDVTKANEFLLKARKCSFDL